MHSATHPEIEEREPLIAASSGPPYPCDDSLRLRLRAMRNGGEISNSRLARGAILNDAVISQYLNDDGNLYPGDTAKAESKIRSWLNRRDTELLAGIATIETAVSRQIAAFAKMLLAGGLMGKLIGRSGIGKTRGAQLLHKRDAASVLIEVTGETGRREAVRAALFAKMGIRGPLKRTANRTRLMYDELVRRFLEADAPPLLILDQAHRLSSPAIDLLTELWNKTHAPQLWLGTPKLVDVLERDEQWASRLALGDELTVTVDAQNDLNEVRPLVRHQVESRIETLKGEGPRLITLCEKLALTGSFRRVEMRLATMLYLHESPKNDGKTWCELFAQAGEYLTETETDE